MSNNPFLYTTVREDAELTPTKFGASCTTLSSPSESNDAADGVPKSTDTATVLQLSEVLSKVDTPEVRHANRVLSINVPLLEAFANLLFNSDETYECPGQPLFPYSQRTLSKCLSEFKKTMADSESSEWPHPAENTSEEFLRKGGWESFIVKVYQLLSVILVQPSSSGRYQTNACDADALIRTLKRYQSTLYEKRELISRHHNSAYRHYHNGHRDAETSSTEAGRSTAVSSTDHTTADEDNFSTLPPRLSDSPASNIDEPQPQPQPPVNSFQLYICLRCGLWKASSSNREAVFKDNCIISKEDNRAIVGIDLDYVAFALRAHGRFDAYMWAALCILLEPVQNAEVGMSVYLPDFLLGNRIMARLRAVHALRVFHDATTSFRVSAGKHDWYVTLLTSGSLAAVQDTFTDLGNDLWHAQFNRADNRSRKRLEKILVALLGHQDNMIRSQAVVMLNTLYDQHDWQQDYPFLPLIRSVGDEFILEVTVHDPADPKKNEKPQGLFLILNAPSFEITSPFETYSYHRIEWDSQTASKYDSTVPVVDSKVQLMRNRGYQLRKGGLHRWIGTIRFGQFMRAGYYDWRIVKADEQCGSWTTVQATLAELKRSFSSSFSFVESDKMFDSDSFSIHNRNLWAELCRLSDLNSRSADGVDCEVSHNMRTLPLQGRFVVQGVSVGKEQFHEIYVDHHGADFFPDGSIKERGNFSTVMSSLSDFRKDGITIIYLMGALARDNGDTLYLPSGEVQFERPDASPFAATCRGTPNQMLGGIDGFRDIMREADRSGIKILVDCLARVSSARPHRKYWPHILYTLDDSGKRRMLYGSDGRSCEFEDTCQLNYRQVEAWDLLVEDVLFWAQRMEVSGVVLDNAHVSPQILSADQEELLRVDPDGQPHYSPEQKLCGEVVLPFTYHESGYWSSSAAENYWPNPLWVRLCQEVWRVSPNFMFVGECRLGEGMEGRAGMLARSGVIPQLQTLPNHLCKVFGKKIEENGEVVNCTPEDVSCLKSWYDKCHEDLPEGAVVIQSSCSHSSPLPALLYGRGVWPAVDLLFFLSDIPSTYMGEQEGHCFRLNIANVFTTKLDDEVPGADTTTVHASDVSATPRSPYDEAPSGRPRPKQKRKLASVRSLLDINLPLEQIPSGSVGISTGTTQAKITKVRSLARFEPVESLGALEEAQHKALGPEFGFDLKQIKTHYCHRRKLRHENGIFRSGLLVPLDAFKAGSSGDPYKHVLAFCRFDIASGAFALSVINFGNEELNGVSVSLRVLGRQFHSMGVDGNAVFQTWNLYANVPGSVPSELKASGNEDSLFALSDSDMTNLLSSSQSAEQEELGMNIITLAELLGEPQQFHLMPYGSCCVGFKIVAQRGSRNPPWSRHVLSALYGSSLRRLEKLVRSVNAHSVVSTTVPKVIMDTIKSNHIVSSLLNAIEMEHDLGALSSVLLDLENAVRQRNSGGTKDAAGRDKSITLFDLLVESQIFVPPAKDGPCVFTRRQPEKIIRPDSGTLLISKIKAILKGKPAVSQSPSNAVLYECCEDFLERNQLGPIVMMTTELGKWSTVGGLGVMVDELSTTLAQDLGQQVIVVSPYYERNRKGETDYLVKDGIVYKSNIRVNVGGQEVVLGVHEGLIKGVRLFFIHNPQYFSHPYPDFGPADSLRYLAVIGKGFLELLCQLKEIPQLIVTNDWPTGLVPAYAKQGHFGDVFNSTTFFHICHNFDPAYEGRIYVDRREDLSWIHGLPHDLLVDPLWANVIFNPSRCAMLQCDAWGTVSPSYRDDLRGLNNPQSASPLAPLLNRYKTPFATPNGIPIETRKARLRSLNCRGHIDAKGLLQRRYFGFQKPDPEIPLFAFIGRITSQKGVHLILDAAEGIIRRYNNRIQILVGGKVNWKDPYSARCAHQMMSLRDRFPYSFWADPNEFFSDGALVNLGADFGLMPSAFEPGGIVQHEFFVAGTPVIAFKTGGLKDTVFEFSLESQMGNGFTFESYNLGDFLFAFERAIRVFMDPAKYQRLRKNCDESVVSTEECANAWLGEFCRLRRKIRVNKVLMEQICARMPAWSESMLNSENLMPIFNVEGHSAEAEKEGAVELNVQMPEAKPMRFSATHKLGVVQKLNAQPMETADARAKMPDISLTPSAMSPGLGAKPNPFNVAPQASVTNARHKHLVNDDDSRRATRIKFVPPVGSNRPRIVALSGSFDDWRVRRPLTWDNTIQAFVLNMALPPGKHFYKLVIDGDWICNPSEPVEKDPITGIPNNVIDVRLN